MNITVNWLPPETIPAVPVGEEREFWIAVYSKHTDKPYVYLAQYQNRPVSLDEHGDPVDDSDLLINVNGEYVDSVGWVMNRQHVDFDNYYEPIRFDDNYKLLGWAEYIPPRPPITPPRQTTL